MSTVQRKLQRVPKKTQSTDATESDSSKATTKQLKAPRKKKTSSSKKKSENKGNAPKDSIKVAVRLLPANLQEDSFWDTVKEFVKPETCHAKYFVQGHYSTKPFKTPIYSRAYIQFKKVSLADAFVEKFKAMPFEDDKESTIPQFTSCLYNRMPEDREEKSSTNHLPLQETPAFKLFLKYKDGEIEKPKTFLSSAKATEKESKEAEKQVELKKVEDKLVKEAADDKTKKKKKKKKRDITEKKDGKKDNSSKDTKIDGKTVQKKDKKPKEKSKSIKDTKDKPPKDTKAQQKKDKPEEKATSEKLTGEKAKPKLKPRRKKEKEKDTKTPQNKPSNSSPSSNASQTSNTQTRPKILIRKQDEDHKDQTLPKVIMKRRPVS